MNLDLTNYPATIQKSYRNILTNKSRFLIYVGGAGAGKSYAIAQKIIYRCLSEPNTNYLVVRKTSVSNRTSTFPLIIKILERLNIKSVVRINKSDLTIDFISPINSTIYFCGLDDVEKLKSFIDLSGIWVEEGSQITRGDFDQLNLRLRGGVGKYHQLIMSSNPIGGTRHWIYQSFIKSYFPDSEVFMPTVFNNQYAEKSYIEALKNQAEQNPTLGKIYLEGQYADVVGQIFDFSTIPDIKYPKLKCRHIYGLDFGFNDPSALIKIYIPENQDEAKKYYNTNKNILFLRQILYHRNLTNQQLMNKLKYYAQKICSKPQKLKIYADSAEPARIEEIRQAGFNIIPAKKGPNSILQSIYFVQNYKLIVDEKSHNLIDELSSYCWRLDKNGQPMDEPADSEDHLIAGLRYAVYNELKVDPDAFNPDEPMIFLPGNLIGKIR